MAAFCGFKPHCSKSLQSCLPLVNQRCLIEEGFWPRSLIIDLQWFAAEDEGRTEQPTEQKVKKAREEEGRVAKSTELVSALVLLFPAILLVIFAPYFLRTFVEMLRFFLTRAAEIDAVRDRRVFAVFLEYLVKLALPMLLVSIVAALGSNIAQVGLVFTLKPLEFNGKRVIPNLLQYFSKTLFSINGLFNLAKSVIKMAVIGITAYIIIRGDFEKITNLDSVSLMLAFTTIASLSARLLIICALLLLALSIPDYMFQRWQYMQNLMMQPHEVKEERKESEGDPLIKARLRARMRELLRQNIAESVPKADVVITNPTHFAVALEWNPSLTGPRVLAKGADDLAFRIKVIAAENGVPVVENKPVARALYAEAEVGDVVPEVYLGILLEIFKRVRSADYWNKKLQR
ncbi:MAG: EscU/YscU/HrcU family type III secretion system export apparatus switch protein [Spirochaetaceae bacterium]|jgi:flagellar biosynthetic protein FlhB|nr:EscU/YscU/HrcU family type III secretion system export apparatus switch protein [Spirochaetaceae bacterium]